MNRPTSPFANSGAGRPMLSRRRLLAGAGGALAAGVFAAHGGVAGARRPSVARAAARAASRPRSGDKPTLSQWYHGYGEEGVQEAVEGYAEIGRASCRERVES